MKKLLWLEKLVVPSFKSPTIVVQFVYRHSEKTKRLGI